MVEHPNDGLQNTSTDLDSESENSPETLSSMLSGVASQKQVTDVLALERQALERERLELERERLRFEKEKSKAEYSSISGSSSLELQKLALELEKLRLEQAKLSQGQVAPVINIINQNTIQNVNNSSSLAFVPPPTPRKNNTTLKIGFFGNVLWFIFGGFIAGISYVIGGLLLCITIIGIPFGLRAIGFGWSVMLPFGKELGKVDGGEGFLAMIFNLLWLIFIGWQLALMHLIIGILFGITIIGIPFAHMHFQIAFVVLLPFSYTLTPIEK